MAAIKRNITDISNLKRGDVQITKVYRGANLIWTNAPVPPTPVTYSIDSFADTYNGYLAPNDGVQMNSFDLAYNGYKKINT